MKKLHLRFDAAENGAEAFEKFSVSPPRYSLVLTDISMPVMDGNKATVKMRELERQRKLPKAMIVAITGVTSTAARKHSLDCGVDRYLTKPVKMTDIKALVEGISELEMT